jgi:phosphoribosyl-AMP cyclohydrolase
VTTTADEEGTIFSPRYDVNGLIPAVVTDDRDGTVVMLAYMNGEALRLTLETGEAHYWSRSRKELWRKGATSGEIQKVVDIRIDCDQDAVLLRVALGGRGLACHTGRHSCFYRRVSRGSQGYNLEII